MVTTFASISYEIKDVALHVLCAGEFDETNVDHSFSEIKQNIAKEGQSIVIFDLSEITYINSKTVGYLAEIANMLQAKGNFMGIFNPKDVQETLDICGLTQIIPTENTIEALYEKAHEATGEDIKVETPNSESVSQGVSESSAQRKTSSHTPTESETQKEKELKEIQSAIEALQERGKKLYRELHASGE